MSVCALLCIPQCHHCIPQVSLEYLRVLLWYSSMPRAPPVFLKFARSPPVSPLYPPESPNLSLYCPCILQGSPESSCAASVSPESLCVVIVSPSVTIVFPSVTIVSPSATIVSARVSQSMYSRVPLCRLCILQRSPKSNCVTPVSRRVPQTLPLSLLYSPGFLKVLLCRSCISPESVCVVTVPLGSSKVFVCPSVYPPVSPLFLPGFPRVPQNPSVSLLYTPESPCTAPVFLKVPRSPPL